VYTASVSTNHSFAVSDDVPDTEDGCTTPSEKVIDPVTPPLDVGSATLIGDGSECLTTDFVAHRARDSPDVAGLWMDVLGFEMAASSGNCLVSQFP
jgi:hypothetical protein